MKAETFLRDTLMHIGVSRPSGDNLDLALRELNDFIAELDADGIRLGYRMLASIQEGVELPDWAYGAIKSNLSIRIAPIFGKDAGAELVAKANRAMRSVTRRALDDLPPIYPDTLPMGAGNDGYGEYPFYPSALDDDILTGGGQSLEGEF